MPTKLPTASQHPVVVTVSADGEWRAVLDLLQPPVLETSPLGAWFPITVAGKERIFFHSGWGKTTSAAACQYVIDHFQPKLLLNLGTCGGLEGYADVGEVLLARSTVIYDIYERMGDPEDAIDRYRAVLDSSWLPGPLPGNTRRADLASADQDIDFNNFDLLVKKFNVVAADWESAPIAWVAQANGVKCLILRGVSDLVRRDGSETDHAHDLWQERARQIMRKMLNDLPYYLRSFDKFQS